MSKYNGKVISLGCLTRLDSPPDVVLEKSIGKMEGVVILGYDKDGEHYFASTYADGGDVLWLLEKAKQMLMDVEI